ncbi:MAG: hypothetical protein ABW186_04035 [Rhodanobacteraceae bacterium]
MLRFVCFSRVASCVLAASFMTSPAFAAAPHAPAGSEAWIQRAKLVASDGAGNDFLGRSVALDGDVAVVGAAGSDPDGAESRGAAYVYVRTSGTWTETAKLTASDGAAGDEFGFAVAISGDTLVVGARFATVDAISGRGAAYVFVRSGDAWTEQTKLVAGDGAAFDELGDSVAIDGDTVLLGAPFRDSSRGKVYAFVRDGQTWSAQGSLTAADGADFDRFGLALAIEGDAALVGSPSADVGANTDQGAVYAFSRSAGTWSFATKLTADDGAAFDEFGNAVSIDADTLAVGAHAANIGSVGNQGAAYAFARTGEAWTQQAKLIDESDGFFGDEFGISVGVSGDDIAVGALFADPDADENEGRAYVFHRDGDSWTRRATLTADDGVSGEEFGIGIAIEAGTVVVGAEFGPVDGDWRGAAYVFSSASAAAVVSPQSLAFEQDPDTTSAAPVAIANVGDAGSVLDYSIVESASADCAAIDDIAWLDASPVSGSVPAGEAAEVGVRVDSTGLANGERIAWLCVSTSDAVQAVVAVEVVLTVSGTDADRIFVDGFDGVP